MRVLVVIDDLRRAGAQRVIVQEARALHPAPVAFDVAVLASTAAPSFAQDLIDEGVAVHYVAGEGLLDPGRIRALRRLIDLSAPDVIHTHLTYANILGVLAATCARRPVVSSLHNADPNQVKWPAAKQCLEGLLLSHLAARVVVVSEAARAVTARNFGIPLERTVVVPNAVDPRSVTLPATYNRDRKRRELGAQPGQPLLCTVGRLDSSKGQRFLLHALADLGSRQCQLPIRALLVGAGPDEEALRGEAVRLQLTDRVMLTGVRDDVAEIIAASDLFVLPSLNEGLSQALLEAMALRIPVVATDVGGTSDVLESGRTGWRVPPAQPMALARAIQQALDEKQLAAGYADAARALVDQRFSMGEHLDRLQRLYSQVGSAG